jgi:hypothetical protein
MSNMKRLEYDGPVGELPAEMINLIGDVVRGKAKVVVDGENWKVLDYNVTHTVDVPEDMVSFVIELKRVTSLGTHQ